MPFSRQALNLYGTYPKWMRQVWQGRAVWQERLLHQQERLEMPMQRREICWQVQQVQQQTFFLEKESVVITSFNI